MPRYFYIVMEYVDGRDLSELYTGSSLEPLLAARITQDVHKQFSITPTTSQPPWMVAPSAV